MKLPELQERLEKFQYAEKALLTDEELETLEKMFSIEGSFNALFRHLCILESEKGTQMMYDIETMGTDGHLDDKEIADQFRVKKAITGHVRGRMEALRNEFARKAQKELSEEEAKVKEEQEKTDKARKEREIDAKGVSPEL